MAGKSGKVADKPKPVPVPIQPTQFTLFPRNNVAASMTLGDVRAPTRYPSSRVQPLMAMKKGGAVKKAAKPMKAKARKK